MAGVLEYATTYGWVLLIVVVAAAGLYAVGVLNPEMYAPSRCTGFQYFLFKDQVLHQEGYALTLANGNAAVRVTGIRAGLMREFVKAEVRVGGAAADLVPAGARFVLAISNDVTDREKGDSAKLPVEISYDIEGGLTGVRDAASCASPVT